MIRPLLPAIVVCLASCSSEYDPDDPESLAVAYLKRVQRGEADASQLLLNDSPQALVDASWTSIQPGGLLKPGRFEDLGSLVLGSGRSGALARYGFASPPGGANGTTFKGALFWNAQFDVHHDDGTKTPAIVSLRFESGKWVVVPSNRESDARPSRRPAPRVEFAEAGKD